MKKIIDKTLYDTEKSELIVEYQNIDDPSDFNYYYETLYKSKKGQYFLVVEGGANSKYAITEGNMSHGSNNILLLTKNEALTWLEDNNFTDAILEYFASEIKEG